MKVDLTDKQGGKSFGKLKEQQSNDLDEINKEALEDELFKEVEDLPEKLERYKQQFMEFDLDHSGDIDIMELKQMLEKLGQAKTHLELKKMISEVDKTNSGTISYREFIDMMLGTKNSVLRLILLFEEKNKEKEKPITPPAKKSLAELP